MSREDVLLDRAIQKAQKWTDDRGYGWTAPSSYNSGCENHNGNEYVVLRFTDKIHSVWLVVGETISLVDEADYPEDLLEEMSA
jgi:hypothetical protein